MRSLDWSKTALGPVGRWPQSLRSPLSMLLPSKAQIILFWGAEFVVFYNDAYRPVFGGKHPQMLGQPGRIAWSEIWDTGANLHGLLQGVVRTGEAFQARDLLFILERNGFVEETYFDVSYDPVRDESGSVGGVFCIVTETTGRVVGERRLALLRDLATQNATARTARDACALAMETLSGRPDVPFALAFLGGELQAATPGAEAARAAAPAAQVRELLIPGGSLVVGLNPQRPFDDQYAAFLELIRGQVATAIANAQAYEEERKRAEALAELDRAKTAFFSNVSHEFRTPLTLMLGPVEDGLADAQNPLPAAQRERLDLVRRNGLRLQKLVNMLLDFSRIEAGRAQASFVPTDLAALTRDLAASFRSALENAGLQLEVDCPALGEPVYVDPSMWEKVVLNLLSNAFKFTFEGAIRVSLARAAGSVALEVSDSGIGISAAELPRIFERFHRVEGVRARTHEGSGIGLALVRELVKLHAGRVSAQSEPGKGTTIRVELPFGATHLPSERIGVRPPVPAGAGSSAFLAEIAQWNASAGIHAHEPADKDTRILVADDNADMRDYIARLLSPYWTVEAVSNGRQALSRARAAPPDLVLSDVMMPGVDGLALLRLLRADERTRTIPVVLLSARAGEEATIDGLNSGADAYLVKPFSAGELIARVSAQLSVSKLRQEQLRAAQRATQARDNVLAMVSHDLRTPLGVIGLNAEVLARAHAGDEKIVGRANAILRSVARMSRLVDDLVDLASMDAGTFAIRRTPQEAGSALREVAESFAGPARDKGVQLSVETGQIPLAMIDRERLMQAVGNLVDNAIRATAAGGRVALRAHADDARVTISVSDDGCGLDPRAAARIFERGARFAPLDPDGHGLGLGIVRGIVEAHGGAISASSEPGRGTTFFVHIPRHEPPGFTAERDAGQSASARPRHPAEPSLP